MAASIILAAGVSIVVGGFVIVLIGELYYLLCWRKRAIGTNPWLSNNVACQEVLVTMDSKDQTTVMEIDMDISSFKGGYPNSTLDAADLVEKLFPPPLSFNPESDTIPLDSLLGPPRLLFTIKEETKEDLEGGTVDCTTKTTMYAVSASKILGIVPRAPKPSTSSPADSPFITPASSPPRTTPQSSPPALVKANAAAIPNSGTATDPESFTPSMESFNTPLDSVLPVSFRVELLSASPSPARAASNRIFSPSSSSPRSPLQTMSSPRSPLRPFASRCGVDGVGFIMNSPKTPFLLPPSPPSIMGSLKLNTSSPSRQTHYYTTVSVSRGSRSPSWGSSPSPSRSPAVPGLATPTCKTREMFLPTQEKSLVEGVRSC